jgi:DNA-binding PadR family transcriptional regulator
MPAEHALLGLIVRAGGEAHGYELARHFDPTHPLGDVLRLEQAMLYQHLKKLERRGWLTMTVQPQESRPPRRVYRITDEGRAELRRWLEEPVARTREIRLEFLVKLFFAVHLDPDRARRLVAEQLAVCRHLAASLEGQIAALGGGNRGNAVSGDEAAFERIVLELRRDQTRAAAAWLERVADWIAGFQG